MRLILRMRDPFNPVCLRNQRSLLVTHNNKFSIVSTQHNQKHTTQIMKLIASALAAASALATVTYAEEIWTSHSDYQACANVMLGAELCTEKFYTVTPGLVLGSQVAETCASLNAFPWCPESEEESINVFANLAVLDYTKPDGNLDIVQWAAEGISKWTGVQLDPAFNGMSKQISNYSALDKFRKK